MDGSVRNGVEDSLLTFFCLLLSGKERGREGELVPLALGNLQENRGAIEVMEGDERRDFSEAQRGF